MTAPALTASALTTSALSVENIHVDFALPQGFMRSPSVLHAVRNISFTVERGQTLSIVGESGSGKSTLARAILGLQRLTAGRVQLGELEISALRGEALRKARAKMQMVFQDPIASLSPRRTIGQIIEEPLQVHFPEMTRDERAKRVAQYMDMMGLRQDMRNRYPHEFSGGQAQRVGIARALIVEPDLLVADEPVSALDVSIQAQVLNLISDIKAERDFTLLFISHDLSVVRHISDHVLVMQKGEVQEMAPAEQIFNNPQSEYTKALLQAIPVF